MSEPLRLFGGGTLLLGPLEVEKADERNPDELERLRREAEATNQRIAKAARDARIRRAPPPRTLAETTAELELLNKEAERHNDAHAEEHLDQLVRSIQQRDPLISKSEAVVKAIEENPDVYTRMQRHAWRQAGFLNDTPGQVRKAADSSRRLETAAAEIRKLEPHLTEAQAITRALENDPSLYHDEE
jgi:hypothetical protein